MRPFRGWLFAFVIFAVVLSSPGATSPGWATTMRVTPPELCAGRMPTIVGTSGNDNLSGTPAVDVILAGEGNDLIAGKAGEDVICAGPGDDTVLSQTGSDTVLGEGGADKLFGLDGADSLTGGPGDDIAFGGTGDDELLGGQGADLLMGGIGSDTGVGGLDGDLLFGGAGGDALNGGADVDVIFGEGGADIITDVSGNDITFQAAAQPTFSATGLSQGDWLSECSRPLLPVADELGVLAHCMPFWDALTAALKALSDANEAFAEQAKTLLLLGAAATELAINVPRLCKNPVGCAAVIAATAALATAIFFATERLETLSDRVLQARKTRDDAQQDLDECLAEHEGEATFPGAHSI